MGLFCTIEPFNMSFLARSIFSLSRPTLLTNSLPRVAFLATRRKPVRPSFLMMAAAEFRPQIVAENPDVNQAEISKKVGELLRTAPAEQLNGIEENYHSKMAAYKKVIDAYNNSLNPRPKKLTFASQLSNLYESKTGSRPSNLSDIHEMGRNLTVAEKEKLGIERKAANASIQVSIEAWNKAHKDGLEALEELKAKHHTDCTAVGFYKRSKAKKWKAFVALPAEFKDCTEAQKEEFHQLHRLHVRRAKRNIRKKLLEAGHDDVALLV
eukprot:m.135398 g.135398  ORF g.135398 m.135398 type:complete len:267 (-) comp9966_c0_seq1:132-932(-)